MLQPLTVSLFLTVFALLIIISVVVSRASQASGIPFALLFLAVGLIAGEEGLGRISFENYQFSFDLGTVALVLILFDGGLNTPLQRIKRGLAPSAVLATLGVVGTAALVGAAALALGFTWMQAFLLGAIVSSTDAAAVYPVLRASGIQLKRRVGLVLELESGLNDPMAVILTVELTQSLLTNRPLGIATAGQIIYALAVGAIGGVIVGWIGRLIIPRARPPAGGLYPVLTLALACLAYGLPALANASGFLGVYVAAMIIGNGPMPYRSGVVHFHDSLAWFAQISMFLMLGLLAFPSQLLSVAWLGLGIGLFLAIVARPLVAVLCLLPFRYPVRETLFIGWAGLRGAVPIILATYPVIARIDGAQTIFNVVFFIVLINAIIPGATIKWAVKWLRLESGEPPPPPAAVDIVSTEMLHGGEILTFFIGASAAVCGAAIADLSFPAESNILLVIRAHELIPPRGATVLMPGDHVYVLCRPEDRAFVHLIFGSAISD
ncbi:MAG: potassium/proton antiporter [Candidatus Binataceae bacterium]